MPYIEPYYHTDKTDWSEAIPSLVITTSRVWCTAVPAETGITAKRQRPEQIMNGISGGAEFITIKARTTAQASR